MTIPAAFTTTLLAWSMLSFPKAYIAAGSVSRSLNQLSWGADYLSKTFTTGASGQIVYQVRLLRLRQALQQERELLQLK